MHLSSHHKIFIMACKSFFIILLSLAYHLSIFQQPLITFAKGDTTLIQKTCKNTKYYDLCFSSLKSDPTSLKTDTKGLAVIMIGVGTAHATATFSFLSSQLIPSSNDTGMKKVLKECADKYTYAGDALEASTKDLATEAYDYAYMHVAAAEDYPNACHNAFRRYPNLLYPPELARREEGLKHICEVALGMIDNLASNN